MSLQQIMATPRPEPAVAEPVRVRRPVVARGNRFELPSLEDLVPGRGNRLTMLGIAIDVATCLVIMTALSLLR